MPEISTSNDIDSYFDGAFPPETDQPDRQTRLREISGFDRISKDLLSANDIPTTYEPLVALGDLEANAATMTRALTKVGYLGTIGLPNGSKKIIVTETGKKEKVVQTGDLFDRGVHPLKMLFRIQGMRHQGMNFVTVAGNHDLHNLHLFSCPSVINDDPKFYQFIERATSYIEAFRNYQARNNQIEKLIAANQSEEIQQHLLDAHAYLIWRFTDPCVSDNNGLFEELKKKYFPDSDKEPSIRDYLRKLHNLFFGNENGTGQLQNYTENVVPFYKEGPILFLHAGLDDNWAEIIEQRGIDGAIEFFRENAGKGNLGEFYGPSSKYGQMFWLRGKDTLTPKAVKVLKKLGITTIIRGHDVQPDNCHSVMKIDEITIINNDVGISKGNVAGIILDTTGQIIGFNPADKERIKVLATLPTMSQKIQEILDDTKPQVQIA